jgi:hypothetical protein
LLIFRVVERARSEERKTYAEDTENAEFAEEEREHQEHSQERLCNRKGTQDPGTKSVSGAPGEKRRTKIEIRKTKNEERKAQSVKRKARSGLATGAG